MVPSRPLLFVMLKFFCPQITGTNDWRKACTYTHTYPQLALVRAPSCGAGWHSWVAGEGHTVPELSADSGRQEMPETKEHWGGAESRKGVLFIVWDILCFRKEPFYDFYE